MSDATTQDTGDQTGAGSGAVYLSFGHCRYCGRNVHTTNAPLPKQCPTCLHEGWNDVGGAPPVDHSRSAYDWDEVEEAGVLAQFRRDARDARTMRDLRVTIESLIDCLRCAAARVAQLKADRDTILRLGPPATATLAATPAPAAPVMRSAPPLDEACACQNGLGLPHTRREFCLPPPPPPYTAAVWGGV